MTREERAREALDRHGLVFMNGTLAYRANVGTGDAAVAAMLAFADAEAAAMRERAGNRFQKAIEDGYPTPAAKVDQCEHGRFGWEDCIACFDIQLLAAVDDIRALPTTEVGNG